MMNRTLKNSIRYSIISLALLAMTACSFHLRNSASLPSALAPIYLGGPTANTEIGQALRYQLTNSNTTVTPSLAKASYQLNLLSEGASRRIISLDRRGLAAEYGLTMSVEFELLDKKGNRVLGPQKVEERRTVTNNPDNVLTTNQDIGIVHTDMAQVLAAQVVRRLGAYATYQLPKQPTPAATETNGDADTNAPAADTAQNPATQN